MTAYTFEPDNGMVVEPVVSVTDPTPLVDDSVRYLCKVCGKELHYGGRGRKPTLCDDHKKGQARAATPKASTRNTSLASDAAMALCNMHSMVAIGANMVGFVDTAGTIVTANDPFFEQAKNALSTDPELCRRILNSGAGTGSVALVIAYGMFLSSVAPAAVNERREKVAEKRRLAELEDQAE